MAAITTILADDDYLVLQDLESMVDWEKLGFHIAGTASNGKAALSLVRRYRAALVITDISMPVMDGFDFIEEVRKDFPEIYVILISSYADFEYAKRAMSEGIQDYILKNEISPALMEEKLSSVRERIRSSHRRRQMDLHRELRAFLEGTGELPESIPPGRQFLFSVFSSHLPLEKLKNHFDHLENYGRQLYEEAEILFPGLFPGSLLFTSGAFLITGIPAGSVAEPLSSTTLSRDFEILRSALAGRAEGLLGLYCRTPLTLPEFRKHYERALPRLNYLCSFPSALPRTLEVLSEKPFVPYGKLFPYETLANGGKHPEDFFRQLRLFLENLASREDADGIFMLYHNLLLQMEELSGHLLQIPEEKYFDRPAELYDFFRSCLEKAKELSGSDEKENLLPAVRLAREYIRDHCSDPSLGIAEIAEAAMLSPSRLSVLFKKETGQTVNDFLTNTRISRAVYLLENTNLRIYEIAEQAGYRSAQYFSQVLQQKTGRKPLDFRRSKP